jgi:hypothetical protein
MKASVSHYKMEKSAHIESGKALRKERDVIFQVIGLLVNTESSDIKEPVESMMGKLNGRLNEWMAQKKRIISDRNLRFGIAYERHRDRNHAFLISVDNLLDIAATAGISQAELEEE